MMKGDFIRKWWPALLIAGFVFIGGGVAYKMTIGIKNNNPGNIRPSNKFKWKGEIGSKDGYVVFDTALNGIRALARNLKTYQEKYGLKTIEDIIYRWAPPSENDTESYIQSVSSKTRMPRNFKLNFADAGQLAAITNAIIHHENGSNPYKDSDVLKAVMSA